MSTKQEEIIMQDVITDSDLEEAKKLASEMVDVKSIKYNIDSLISKIEPIKTYLSFENHSKELEYMLNLLVKTKKEQSVFDYKDIFFKALPSLNSFYKNFNSKFTEEIYKSESELILSIAKVFSTELDPEILYIKSIGEDYA